jgi:hypothetical protein
LVTIHRNMTPHAVVILISLAAAAIALIWWEKVLALDFTWPRPGLFIVDNHTVGYFVAPIPFGLLQQACLGGLRRRLSHSL